MCYRLKDEILIRIEEKTKEFKYEFLSAYIPMWNKIICGRRRRKRAIIDTHAGTGKVLLKDSEINGSSLIFLEKTALKQEALNFYFIEKDPDNWRALNRNVKEVCEHGIFFPAIYKKKSKGFQKDGLIFEKKPILYQMRTVYPEKEDIHVLKGDCVKKILHVLKEIKDIPAFFFIDPCGKLEWELIQKIINKRLLDEKGNVIIDKNNKKFQGTELFINFSWEAISRTNTPKKDKNIRNKFFKCMFGMTLNDVERQKTKVKKEMIRTHTRYSEYDLYLEIYKNILKKYFDFVKELTIIGLKSEKNPVYAMIFCTNNDSAKKLFENKEAELNKLKKQYLYFKKLTTNKKEYTYEKYKNGILGQKRLDEF